MNDTCGNRTLNNSTGTTWEDVEVGLYAVIGLIGILNNGFTMVVIMSSKAMREKTTNKMIMNQTAIDWIASWLFLANAFTVKSSTIPQSGDGRLYCRLWGTNYFMWSVLNALSFNLMALTLERYFAVVKPVIYRKFTPFKAKLVMFIVWVAGFVITAPHIFAAEVCTTEDGGRICIPYPDDTSTFLLVNGVINYIAVFLAPVLIMFCCYGCMILVFHKKAPAKEESLTKSSAERKRSLKLRKLQLNIFKTFIIVSVAFIFCWAPSQTFIVLFNLGVSSINLNSSGVKLTYFLTYANCCMNPFIYTFQYDDFKVALKKLLRMNSKTERKQRPDILTNDSVAVSDFSTNAE